MTEESGLKFSTIGIHGDDGIEKTNDIAPPLHLSVTFESNKDDQNVYARNSTSTRKRVEELLGKLCSGYACVFSSGQAALFSAISAIKPKRVIFVSKGGYHGSSVLLQKFEDIQVIKGIKDVEIKKGDLLYLETPLNPTVDLVDIKKISNGAKERGALIIVDSTIGPPPLTYPIKLGADFVYYSATKYLGGHSDLLLGVIVTKHLNFISKLKSERTTYGNVPGSLDTWLLLRSLRTLDLRVRKQSQNSIKLANWLSNRKEVEKVWHTSLKSHPSYELAKEQFENGEHPPLIAIELHSEKHAKLLPELCKVFRNATSLGSIESLIEWRFKFDYSLSKKLIRLSIGIEDVDDLIKDLEQGFETLKERDPEELVSKFNSQVTLENMFRLKYSMEYLQELKNEGTITERKYNEKKQYLLIKYDIMDESQVDKFSVDKFLDKKIYQKSQPTPKAENHAFTIFMFFAGLFFFTLFLISKKVKIQPADFFKNF